MGAHTPGPWIVSDYDWTTVYVKGDGTESGIASTAGDDIAALDVVTQRANARLIAATPDLLTALQSVLREFPAALMRGHATPDTLAAFKEAEVAVAKATGTPP